MKQCNKQFISEVNELCDECPIRAKINDVRLKMIRKCELIKSVNTIDFYTDYLKKQIELANGKIKRIIERVQNKHDIGYRENNNALYLSWKDCIAYYNEQLNTLKVKPKNPKEIFLKSFPLRIGTLEKGCEQKILEILIDGNLIKQGTKATLFKKIFLGCEMKNKIEWIGTVPALHDFVVAVWKFQDMKHGKWDIARLCFNHVDNDLKNIHNNKKAIAKKDATTIKKAMKFFNVTTT